MFFFTNLMKNANIKLTSSKVQPLICFIDKILGCFIDNKLRWTDHINYMLTLKYLNL